MNLPLLPTLTALSHLVSPKISPSGITASSKNNQTTHNKNSNHTKKFVSDADEMSFHVFAKEK